MEFFYPPIHHIAPSSVTFGDSYGLRSFALDCIELSPGQSDPRGEAYATSYVEVIATVFFYINLTGFAKAFPWGGRWAGPSGRVG